MRLTDHGSLGILRRLPQMSLLLRAILLGVVVLVAASVILPLGWAISGSRMGLLAGAVAGGVCLLAAWLALGLSEPLRRQQNVLALVLVGMTIRVGVPLAAALAVFFLGGPLANAGLSILCSLVLLADAGCGDISLHAPMRAQ